MKFFKYISLSLLLLCGCQVKQADIPAFDWLQGANRPDLSWAREVGAVTHPKGDTFVVNDFGADATGNTLTTTAIQAAINACATSGGGKVTFKPGTYLTGAIFVKSGVELHIPEGTMLVASEDLAEYPELDSRIAGIEMVWPSAVLNIVNQQNAAISGNGIIDCKGEVFWNKYWEMRKEYEKENLRWIVDYDCKRVRGVLVSESKNITLSDFTLRRTGFWGVQILYSELCTLNGLMVNNNYGGHGPSTDGIDIDSSSRILIENCEVDCNDDNICLKAGRDADGLRVDRPTEYVVIRNCIARKGAGLITCGSETSGGIRNILAYDLKAYGTTTMLRMKSALNRGGIVENIYMDRVEGDTVKFVIAADLNWNPKYSYSELPEKFAGEEIPPHWTVMLTPVQPVELGYPRFRNVYLSNARVNYADTFITASGWNDDLKLSNFCFYNIEANAQKAGFVRYTDGFRFDNIRLKTADQSEIAFTSNQNLSPVVTYLK